MPKPDSQTQDAPLVRFAKEIRLAVVLYGGVSLAIYINGAVQELLHLVRATAEDKAGGVGAGRARFRDYDENHSGNPEYLSEVEQVYRDIARIKTTGCGEFAEPGTITTRFVVDVVSGASAGGINGVFLGKALAGGKGISELQDLWLNEAEFDVLLNDEVSVRGEGLALQDPPQSLLNSRRLYLEILKALRAMDTSPGDGKGSLLDDLDVFLTTTDLRGKPIALEVMGRRVEELRYKHVFHLVTKHLGPTFTPFLAFAARATSSFPVAFEPMRLADIDAAVDLVYGRDGINLRSTSATWDEFMSPFQQQGHAEWRAFADGGALDNKPFGHAIDALLQREANVPVDRKLLYVEPDPEDVAHVATPETPPDFVENGFACLVTLPGYETIREDVQRILNRNRFVERIRASMDMIEELDIAVVKDPDWKNRDFATESKGRDSAYLGYYKLKVSEATDELARIVTCAAGLNPASDDLTAIRAMVRRWREIRYRNRFNEFLMDFDYSYRVRRLRFVLRKIDRLAREGRTKEECTRLSALKIELSDCLTSLLKRRESYCSGENPMEGFDAAVNDFLKQAGNGRDLLQKWLVNDISEELIRSDGLERIRAIVAKDFYATFTRLSGRVQAVLAGDDAMSVKVRGYYESFEKYDSAIFPLNYGTDVGELDPVELVRISPKDCVSLLDQEESHCKKLAGTKLAHFGALFKRTWRDNDILWGRLDTAERIITALAPPGQDQFIRRAQRAILRETFANRDQREISQMISAAVLFTDSRRPNLTALEALYGRITALNLGIAVPSLSDVKRYYLENFREDGGFEPELTARELARSTTILGKMLEDVAAKHSVKKQWVSWLVYTGWAMWGLIEISMPRRLSNILAKHWMSLLYLMGVLVVFIGNFRGANAASLGWRIIGFTALAQVASIHIGNLLRPRRAAARMPIAAPLRTAISFLFAGAALLLATGNPYGVLQKLLSYWPAVAQDAMASKFSGWALPVSLFATIVTGSLITVFEKRGIAASMKRLPPQPIMEMALCGDVGRFWNMAGDYRAAPAGFFRKALWVDCLFAVAYPAMFISLGYLCAFHFFGRAGWPFSLIYALATVTGVLDLRENAGILRLLGKGPASSDSFQIMRLRAASVQKWVFFFLTAGASGLALLILQLYPGPSFQPSWMITGAGILMTLASLVGLTNIRNVRNTQDLMRTIRDAMRSVQMALLIIVVLYLVLGIQAFIA